MSRYAQVCRKELDNTTDELVRNIPKATGKNMECFSHVSREPKSVFATVCQLKHPDSPSHEFHTVAFLYCHVLMIRDTLKLVMGFMLLNFHSHRRWSVMDSVRLIFMCFQTFGDDHFQRFPCGSSCADNINSRQLETKIA